MRANDRIILILVPLLVLSALFWFLLISPKRQDADDLQTQIDSTESEIAVAEDQIALAETARADFPKTYGELVELGRAVPEDDDQATLVYDMSELGKENNLDFRAFMVKPGEGQAEAAAPPPVAATPADAAAESEAQVAAVEAQVLDAEATEATAAALPIGATVGPAGLPVMPYDFVYTGNFFNVADFLGDVDGQVTTKSGDPVVHGRLMTIDGFSLTGDKLTGFPSVEANFTVTTYIVPPEQGISGGATPAGPAPVASGSPSTVSTDPAAAGTPTAAVAP